MVSHISFLIKKRFEDSVRVLKPFLLIERYFILCYDVFMLL